jgi:hypothetical protein
VVQTTAQGFGYACFRGYRHIAFSDWPLTYIGRCQLADPMVLEVAGPFVHDDTGPTTVAALAFLQREAAAQTDLPLEMADSGYGEPPRSVAHAQECVLFLSAALSNFFVNKALLIMFWMGLQASWSSGCWTVVLGQS